MGAEARAAIASRQARAAESRAQRAEEERRQVQARVAERERAKRETFGGERLPQAQALAREERLDSLEARVVETLTSSRGQLVFVLDNGQQWRQYEAQSMPPIRANDQVVIQRASLGSYRLVIPRLGRATKVTRDR